MKFNLDGLTVYFPYSYLYPEQYQYMCALTYRTPPPHRSYPLGYLCNTPATHESDGSHNKSRVSCSF